MRRFARRRIGLALAMTSLIAANGDAPRAEAPLAVVATLEGPQALAIQTALAVFAREGHDARPYRLVLLESDRYYTVLFSDPIWPESTRGSAKERPEYEVLLDKQSLAVIAAHFIR